MNKAEKALARAKKIQCVLGVFFLIPPVLGVLSFVLCLFGCESPFATLRHLSEGWTGGEDGMSSTPIYLGLMALVGAYLLNDSLHYFFLGKDSEK